MYRLFFDIRKRIKKIRWEKEKKLPLAIFRRQLWLCTYNIRFP